MDGATILKVAPDTDGAIYLNIAVITTHIMTNDTYSTETESHHNISMIILILFTHTYATVQITNVNKVH